MAAALGDGEAGGLGEGWDGVGGRLGRAWGRGGGGGGAARGPHPHVDLGAGHPGAQPQEGHAPRHLAGTVELAESVAEGAGAAVPVPLWADVPGAVPEGERDAVALLESDTLGLGQWQREEGTPWRCLESDTLGVLLAEGPLVSEAVGEAVTVELRLSVVEGVREPAPVPLPVGLPVAVGVGVSGGVPELEREVLPVFEAKAPAVREAAGEADRVELAESVGEGVKAAGPVPPQ